MPDGARLLLTGRGRILLPEPGPSPWAVLVEDGVVRRVGPLTDAPAAGDLERIDLGDALVTPGLVDAHAHPAFAGDRSDEVAARLAGGEYSGGGIRRTVRATRAASDEELTDLVEQRLRAALAHGTTTIECKSGYGLDTEHELRSLRLIRHAAERVGIRAVRTFLGAHAVPEGMSREDYVHLLIAEMLPAVADEADFCDVFCDRGFFTLDDASRILGAARERGLGLRIHADQLTRSGAAELAVRLGATSADHLEQLSAEGVAALAGSSTVATLLPGPALVMRDRLPPARALLDAGATLALGSDANAGTFGSWSMPLVIGLAATLLQMTLAEAVTAATSGGAASLGRTALAGAIRPGMPADLVAWRAIHEGAFALRLGAVEPLQVWVGGVARLSLTP
ncbi:MAG TPA: imidazolonepropionase [Candidatus Limnocylindria bacterium]|nr:imidazolonepropionase [Candidatus Limnocylindria bacterium]